MGPNWPHLDSKYGCMDVWMYGCVDVCMYGCMDVCMSLQNLKTQPLKSLHENVLLEIVLCHVLLRRVGGVHERDTSIYGWMDGWMDG